VTTAERLRTYWGERQIDRERLTALAVRYWEIALYAGLVGLALGMRLWGLGSRAIHHDESLHMFYSWELAEGRGYVHVPFMHGPLQFFLNAAIFKVPFFGDNDFTARLVYAIFGAALVALPFFLRGFLGRTGALLAALLLAFSPSLLYFSRFARNDILIAFFTLATVVVIWRYLKERKESYLLALPALLMLGFATKEVTFITTAMFLVYLEVLLAQDLVDQVRASRALSPAQTLLAYAFFLAFGWAVAILWPLLEQQRKRWSLETLPAAAHLAIVMGTFALPQFAPAIQRIGFGDVNLYDEPPGPEPLMQLSILLALLISAYIGLMWNWRVWALGAAIFYVPYFLLYTTFFTNGGDIWNPGGDFWHGEGGWWTGVWGSLDYWLSQQLVRRGSQPDYYYMMTVPVYEFLPLIFATGGALFYAFRGKLEQKLLSLAAVLLITVFALIPEGSAGFIGDHHEAWAFLVALAAVLLLPMEAFTKFLLYWALAMYFGVTVAGEKMPWLTVHIALPLALLAAKIVADVLSAVATEFSRRREAAARTRAERRGEDEEAASFAPERLLPLAAGGAFGLLAALIFQATGPASGPSVLAWLLALGALGAVLWTYRGYSWRAAGQVAVVALFASMFVFTVRAAGMAAYDEGDPDGYPQELLIYAQGSPKLDIILAQIEELGEVSGLGKDLNVIVDNSVNVWPWPWYLRDQRHELNNFDGTFAPAPGSVVLVSVSNQDQMQPYLDDYLDPIPYTHMWWFPEFYKGESRGPASPSDFLSTFFSGAYFSAWRAYLIDRDVFGASAGPDMLAFFPKGFDFDVDVPPTPGIAGPSAPLPEGSYTIIGAPGSGPGAFSQPADIAVDAEGNLYIVDTLNHRVQKIAPDGQATVIGQLGGDEGQFADPFSDDYQVHDGPWGVAIDSRGTLYVADTWGYRIQKFGPDLQFIQQWGIGELFGPRDVEIDAEGNVLVVDTGNKRIMIYRENGEFVRFFGRPGGGPGEFSEPSSLSIAPNGDIYVADYWNQRIQHFDPTFEYVGEIAVPSWGSQGVTDRAYIVALEGGRVLATDPANGRVLAFGPDGTEVASWRLPTGIGTTRPVGIAIDANGMVYISDGATSQVVRVSVLQLFAPPPPSE
jgi:predicted membrane-bound mannosyltransferase/DNA-binding beta-propeller fold protein YncE